MPPPLDTCLSWFTRGKVFNSELSKGILRNYKSGFTLAEVLITLGIIGVVAAMTLPVLTAKYKQITCTSKLKKMYSVLSQAMLFTVQKDGDYSSLSFSDTGPSVLNWYQTALKPYIKVAKECYETSGCWHNSGTTKFLNGTTATYDRGSIGVGYGIVVFQTVDGYMVDMDGYAPADASNRFGVDCTTDTLAVYVDVNGNGRPNVIGKDIYVFVFTSKGFLPAGHDRTDDEVNSDCSKNGTGYFCFEKIVRNGWQIDKENLW